MKNLILIIIFIITVKTMNVTLIIIFIITVFLYNFCSLFNSFCMFFNNFNYEFFMFILKVHYDKFTFHGFQPIFVILSAVSDSVSDKKNIKSQTV
jgi:hypothetical protein